MLKLDEKEYPYMRQTAWRWLATAEVHTNLESILSPLQRDPIILESARFLKSHRHVNSSRAFFRRNYPEVSEAFELYGRSRAHDYRWLIEAAIAGNASNEDLADLIPVEAGPYVFEVYRKMFFDIDDYRDSPWAVHANIMATAYQTANSINNYDLTWKLLAYQHGLDAFNKFILNEPLAKDMQRWMEQIIKKRYTVHTFQVTSNMRMAYSEDIRGILATAGQYFEINKEGFGSKDDQLDEDDLHALMKTIHFTVMDAEMKPGAVEDRMHGDYNVFSAASRETLPSAN